VPPAPPEADGEAVEDAIPSALPDSDNLAEADG